MLLSLTNTIVYFVLFSQKNNVILSFYKLLDAQHEGLQHHCTSVFNLTISEKVCETGYKSHMVCSVPHVAFHNSTYFHLIIRDNMVLMLLSVTFKTQHNVKLYNSTLMLSLSNSKIYEYGLGQGYKSYLAHGVSYKIVLYITYSLLIAKQKLDQLYAVKFLYLTAIYKICMFYVMKYTTDMTTIMVKRHCLSYYVSLAEFSGDMYLLEIICSTTVALFQMICSGYVYVKQFKGMLTHILSQRILSEQSRFTFRLSPDKSVREITTFLVYSDKNCAILQTNAPNKINNLKLTSICRAWCRYSIKLYVIHLDTQSQLSIREPTFYFIPNNKNEITIQLDLRMICGSLFESYKTNGDFILLGQESDELLVNHMLQCLMPSDQPYTGQMMSHADYMLHSPMSLYHPFPDQMVTHDDNMLLSLMPLVQILSDQIVSHDDSMLYSLMPHNHPFPDQMVAHDDKMSLSLMPPVQTLSGQMVSHEDGILYSLMSHDQSLPDQRISHDDYMVRLPIFGSNPPILWDGSSVLKSSTQNLDGSINLWTSARSEGFGNPPEGSSGGAQNWSGSTIFINGHGTSPTNEILGRENQSRGLGTHGGSSPHQILARETIHRELGPHLREASILPTETGGGQQL